MELKLINRKREDYPRVNYIDQNNVQWIEINRGCKRGCSFCYADPNYKVFDVPEIKSNKVQIIGEGFLYDPDIIKKIRILGETKFNDKVVYYGLNQGIDFRLLDEEMAFLLSKKRFGIINGKGNWYKGIKFAWDGIETYEKLAKDTIDLFVSVGYIREKIQVFVLVNWKISYDICIYKLNKLKEWGVKIDDCTWNTTKREMVPLYWNKEQLKDFRRKSRKHNQLILFRGYDPEAKK